MTRFHERTILITGGTSGIGLATAQRLLREGARVAVTGSRPDSLARARDVLGPGALVIANDAGRPSTGQELAASLREHGVALHGAFLNAGFGRFQPFDAVTADEFDAQFGVNVRGPLLHAGALAPILLDGASVVLNTSVVQSLGMPGAAVYAATKAALRSVTRTLARELAPRRIRVNAVSPGPISTEFFSRTGLPAEAIAEFGRSILGQVPLGRFGTADEVGAVAAFLLSDEASFVTGAEYVVDGGMTEL